MILLVKRAFRFIFETFITSITFNKFPKNNKFMKLNVFANITDKYVFTEHHFKFK